MKRHNFEFEKLIISKAVALKIEVACATALTPLHYDLSIEMRWRNLVMVNTLIKLKMMGYQHNS